MSPGGSNLKESLTFCSSSSCDVLLELNFVVDVPSRLWFVRLLRFGAAEDMAVSGALEGAIDVITL